MMRAQGMLIGVDVGSSTMSGGLVTPDGTIVHGTQTPTQRDGPGTALESLRRVVGDLLAHARDRGWPIEGIGMGLSGLVDAEAGAMTKGIERFPELAGFPLAERMRSETGCPVFLDNDVNALALGEWTWGRGRDAASLVVLALGTGIGAGILLDGRLVRGRGGCAGEFGHVSIDLNGRRCVCGARGCLGAYAAGYGIATETRRRASRDGDVPEDEEFLPDAEPVFRQAAAGDDIARAVIAEACRGLGAGLAGIVNGLNPELIVVTGGVMKSLVAWERSIRDHLAEYALPAGLASTRIEFVPGEKTLTVRGGAALVLYEQSRRAALR